MIKQEATQKAGPALTGLIDASGSGMDVSALGVVGLCAPEMICPVLVVAWGMSLDPRSGPPMIAGLEQRYDRRSAELDLAYTESVLDEARAALGSNQRVQTTIAPLEHRSRFLVRQDPAAMSMRWMGPKSPPQLRVDPLTLRLLDRPVLKLGLVQQLARMPYERVFNALAAVAGPMVPITLLALWWFVGATAGFVFLVVGALAVFPVATALLRWSVYRSDAKALQVCSGDVEGFKMLLSFNDWNETDALREGTVMASRLPWWLDVQPKSTKRLQAV